MKKLLMLLLMLLITLSVYAEGQKNVAPEQGGFSIALLDANNNNSWRIQMEADIQKLIDEYKKKGIVSRYVAFSANDEATLQSQQMDQLVNEGVDCILVNPVSSTSLNPIIDRAIARGVLVVAIDSTIDHPEVIVVTNNQFNYAKIHAEWLVEQIGGKGKIIQLNAIAGVPANDERESIYKKILSSKQDIEILATDYHFWNNSKAKQITAGFLSVYPAIDAVLTQECTPGVIAAFIEAGRPFPKAVSGDESIEGLRLWAKHDYNSLMVENPPGVGANGLMIAIGLLQGRKLDKSKLVNDHILMINQQLIITRENRDEWIEKTKHMGDNEYIDSVMAQEQIDTFFLD